MCSKHFKSHKTLTQHNRDVHIEGDFPCSLCDTTFRTKRHLAHHLFNKHKEKESMQCCCWNIFTVFICDKAEYIHCLLCFFLMCTLKLFQMNKQNNMHCIYMIPLHCLFPLSLFWWPEPLRNISGCVFLFNGLGLLRATLCAISGFGKGKITAHNVGTKIGLIGHMAFSARSAWASRPPPVFFVERYLVSTAGAPMAITV